MNSSTPNNINNPIITRIIALVGLAILIICAIAGAFYVSTVYKPGQDQVRAAKTETQIVGQATSIFLTEIGKTEMASASQTQAAIPTVTLTATLPPATLTPTLTPTDLPTLTATVAFTPIACSARTGSVDRLMYPWPDTGQFSNGTNIPAGATFKVVGKLADRSWYQVNYNEKTGWLRSSGINISGCEPNQYDLHYLQNWVGPADRLVIDDTFSQGKYEWTNSLGQNMRTEIGTDGEGQLKISAGTETVIVSTTQLQNSAIGDFTMRGAFTRSNSGPNSFIGVRFQDDGTNYYQLQLELGPNTCDLSIYATSQLLHVMEMAPIVCYSAVYDFELSFINDNSVKLWVNGQRILDGFSLPDPNGIFTNGDIRLVVKNSDAVFDFVVVTAPNQ